MFKGRLLHEKLMAQINALHLELFECDEVCFDFCGGNTHHFNRIFLILETDARSEISGCGKNYHLKKGAVYFLSAGNRYEFKFTSRTVLISFHFNLFFTDGMDIFAHSSIFAEESHEQEWSEAVKQCVQNEHSLYNACMLHQLLMKFILRFIPENRVEQLLSRPFDAAVFKYLQEKATAETAIADLAEAAGVSADLLSRHFSRNYRLTLKKCLDRAICAKAERLLRRRELKISEIAGLLKFKNEYYFNTFFKRETGKTPGGFRSALCNWQISAEQDRPQSPDLLNKYS